MTTRQILALGVLCAFVAIVSATSSIRTSAHPRKAAVDPGVRAGAAGAGNPLNGLTADETAFFQDGQGRFAEIEVVQGGANNGLGPRFNSNQCFSCHTQPAIGGTSPAQNPLPAVAHLNGATNAVPWFIAQNGPVREARFKTTNGIPDGNVHALFVITGRTDAPGCNIAQFDFLPSGNPLTGQGGNPNIIFRIPTPVFGAGLIEAIPDSAILANLQANVEEKSAMGISGHPNSHLSGNVNRSGNDGTITRFGWKAQNKSLLMFAGEAYNVEMGITNELFPNERPLPQEDQQGSGLPASCLNLGGIGYPEDATNFTVTPSSDQATQNAQVPADIVLFAEFMRLLAPPIPSTTTPGGAAAISEGAAEFVDVGCAMCHTPSIQSTQPSDVTPSLGGAAVNAFSDLEIHAMGAGLADNVSQGGAGGAQFRTAPLWGLGQRIFFLHDGRTTDLLTAIRDHASSGSEATQVIENFESLRPRQQQNILDFLRSL